MHYPQQIIPIIISILTLIVVPIQADPLIHLKNNSDRIIAVQPFSPGMTFRAESVNPDNEYSYGDVKSSAKIEGLNISICGTTSENTICDFKQGKKQERFDFAPDPKTQRYYVKFTVDKNDSPSLAPQKGSLWGRSSNLKYSLSGNIKDTQISKFQSKNGASAAPIAAAKPAVPAQKETKPTSKPTAKPTIQVSRQELSPIDKLVAKTYGFDVLERYHAALRKKGFSGHFIDPTANYTSEALKNMIVTLVNETIQKINGSESRDVKLYWIILPAYYKAKMMQAMMKSSRDPHPSTQANINAAEDALRDLLAQTTNEYGLDTSIYVLVQDFEQENR